MDDDYQPDPSLQGDWVKKFVGEDIMAPPKNPILKDVDPHADDLSDEIKQAIAEECQTNPAYFVDYVLKNAPNNTISGWKFNILQRLIESETIYPIRSAVLEPPAFMGNELPKITLHFHNCTKLPSQDIKLEFTETVKGNDPLAKWFADWAALSIKDK